MTRMKLAVEIALYAARNMIFSVKILQTAQREGNGPPKSPSLADAYDPEPDFAQSTLNNRRPAGT